MPVKPIWVVMSAKHNGRHGYPYLVTIWHIEHKRFYTWEVPSITDNEIYAQWAE